MITKNTYTNGTYSIEVTFRPFRSGEDEAILSCLRDEYGDTYDNPDYYVPGYFTAQVEKGIQLITVAELSGGEVIGFLIMKSQPYFPGQLEMSTMVFKKQWRNYHISGPLIAHCCRLAEQMHISAYFGHAQVFHTRSIAKLYEQDLMPCGFMLSMTITDSLHHSFGHLRMPKLPWAVVLKNVEKKNAGTLYLPPQHEAVSRRIYNDLGVDYSICTNETVPVQTRSELRVLSYQQQNTLWIMADRLGEDLPERIAAEIAAMPQHLLTANVCLNVNDPAAVWAFHALRDRGFFFSGFQPLSNGAEYMILHNPLDVEILFDEFVPFEPNQYLLEYVKEEYRRAAQSTAAVL